jgi:hypothetical protein
MSRWYNRVDKGDVQISLLLQSALPLFSHSELRIFDAIHVAVNLTWPKVVNDGVSTVIDLEERGDQV